MKFILYVGLAIIALVFHSEITLLLKVVCRLPILIVYSFIDGTKKNDTFPYYGCKFYCGKQGSGKTMSMVNELNYIKKKYPECKIYTNFGYILQDKPLTELSDLTDKNLYNGEKGVVFALDEIQNEFSSIGSKTMPPDILSVVTQQRKQKIYIICTSQVFTRIAKPLREQAFYVADCFTIKGRLTGSIVYDGYEYAETVDISSDNKRKKRYIMGTNVFIQTDKKRNLYDSYAVVEKLKRGTNDEKVSIYYNCD